MLQTMTQEQQDALLGASMREFDSLGKEIGTLRGETERIASKLLAAAHILEVQPENLIFDRESHDMRFHSQQTFNPRDFDAKRILEITNEIREKIVRRDRLRNTLQQMGMNPANLQ